MSATTCLQASRHIVATGMYSKEKLKEAGADVVLDNLKDTESILKILV